MLDRGQADLDVVHIPLWKGGVIAATTVVDADVAPSLTNRRWHLFESAGQHQYAVQITYGGGRTHFVFMHRELLGLPASRGKDGLLVDHINGDGLDNRRANLREATHAQNMQNRKKHRHGRSRFRGVTWNGSRNVWRAQVTLDKRRHNLGSYRDEEQAARAVEAFRRQMMPFAEPDPALLAA